MAQIPGSSLKGMLRAVAEAVSQSCFRVGNLGGRISKEFESCSNPDEACPCCRLFGGIFSERQDSGGYQGKVYLTDAKALGNVRIEQIRVNTHDQGLPTLDRGRRFFAHKPFEEGSKYPVPVVHEKSEFQFLIDFEGLTDDELGLLLYSIVLESNMAHKLGFMKSRGLGSVKIKITEVECTKKFPDVYSSFDAKMVGTHLADADRIRTEFIEPKIKGYLAKSNLTGSQHLQELRSRLNCDF
jgi:CRISPR/Cas system CSM-associated protein Csm3 (group 7 of RAMP superfamily)